MSPTTVLYLDHTAQLSGGEISLLRLLRSVDKSRVTPVVLLAEEGPLVNALSQAGIEVHVLPLDESVRKIKKDTLTLGSASRRFGAGIRLLRYAQAVARWATRRGIDIIHTNSLKADIYGALAAKLAHLPVVWHVRDRIDRNYLPPLAACAFRRMAHVLPDHVVANSQSTLETLLYRRKGASIPRRNFRVVHNGLGDEELNDGGRLAAGTVGSNSPLRIGIVGRLAHWKGQHIFLEAASLLLRGGARHDLEFVIVGAALFGEHAYEACLREQTGALNLADRVTFLGFQKDIPAVLRNIDILVHASITPEPFGQVILEGMAMGVPVVATDAGGVREIIVHDKTGILVPIGNAPALADALRALVCDPARRRTLGRAGYEHACQNFRAAQTARGVESVYRDIVSDRKPRRFQTLPRDIGRLL